MPATERDPLQNLRNVLPFRDLNHADLQEVCFLSHPRQVEADSYYFHQGDPALHVYVLTEGRIKLTQVTEAGHQVILRVAVPWQLFGIIGVLPEKIYPVSAQAIEDSRAIAWDGEALYRFAQHHPSILVNSMNMMSENLSEFQDLFRHLATEQVEQRLARLLLRLVRQVGRKVEQGVLIDLALTRQDLAEMTGATLYTVSRMLSNWERQGIVMVGRERIVITDNHKLVSIAEDLPPSLQKP
ncbi:MAG: Crp/Fnr family transcriptional regulator [Anaerolineales bacterium]|nr:MAG: Crp/Fnr family transcriptional regulator [Anaerolineales bacterium]